MCCFIFEANIDNIDMDNECSEETNGTHEKDLYELEEVN